jgi:hypothetical protein
MGGRGMDDQMYWNEGDIEEKKIRGRGISWSS